MTGDRVQCGDITVLRASSELFSLEETLADRSAQLHPPPPQRRPSTAMGLHSASIRITEYQHAANNPQPKREQRHSESEDSEGEETVTQFLSPTRLVRK